MVKEVLEKTDSLCPVCLQRIPAQIIEENNNVYLEKSCQSHGKFKTIIWRDAESWKKWNNLNDWSPDRSEGGEFATKSKNGCPFDCGLCPKHLRYPCIVVMEITNRCDLNCPICFVNANAAGYVYDADLDTIEDMYKTVLRHGCKFSKPTIQLSGGEPTIRDDLPLIITMGKESGFDHFIVNTNGIRISKDKRYLYNLKECGADVIYLQFDGVSDDVYIRIRSTRLMDTKVKAIKNCAEVGICVILVPTIVKDINFNQIGKIIQFAKKWIPTVRGIHFQPISYFGRYPYKFYNAKRLTTLDMLNAIETQTNGEIRANNFVPVRLGLGSEAHCSFTNLSILGKNNRLTPVTYFPSESEIIKSKGNRIGKVGPKHSRAQIKEYWKSIDEPSSKICACRWTYGTLDNPESLKRNYLSISGMPFQDAMNIETRRLKKCCVQVVTPDNRLIPFCAFNVTNVDNETLYRNYVFRQYCDQRSGMYP